MNAIPQPDSFQVHAPDAVSSHRRNPRSVEEMLVVVEYLKSLERPLTDEELTAKYPEDDADEDAKWLDRDPAYLARIDD